MIVKEYSLKFHQLSCYVSKIASSMRARMRKFASELSRDWILESNVTFLNKDMDISKLVVFIK